MEPLRILLRGKRTDGSVQDVTARAQLKSLNKKITTVSKAGLIKPVADGVTTVSVFVQDQVGKQRINHVEPMKSLLLQKAVGAVEHPGPKLTAGTPEYEILVSWLLRGAPWIDANEAQIVALKVSPAARVLKKEESQQLLVSAVYSDQTLFLEHAAPDVRPEFRERVAGHAACHTPNGSQQRIVALVHAARPVLV